MSHQAAREEILLRMELELGENLHYHSIGHTLEVMDALVKIVEHEEVDKWEMEMLLTAAAYHDCGFIRSYTNHEAVSCDITRETLPRFGFSEKDISQIEELIMATKVPQAPTSRLACILCDADLYYLGGESYKTTSDKLYQELNANGAPISDLKWLSTQINFLTKHRFWTNYAREHLDPKKQKVVNALIVRQLDMS